MRKILWINPDSQRDDTIRRFIEQFWVMLFRSYDKLMLRGTIQYEKNPLLFIQANYFHDIAKIEFDKINWNFEASGGISFSSPACEGESEHTSWNLITLPDSQMFPGVKPYPVAGIDMSRNFGMLSYQNSKVYCNIARSANMCNLGFVPGTMVWVTA